MKSPTLVQNLMTFNFQSNMTESEHQTWLQLLNCQKWIDRWIGLSLLLECFQQCCVSSFSNPFFSSTGRGAQGSVFKIPDMAAMLSFSICRKRDVPCLVRVSPVDQPPESGYWLCQWLAGETETVSQKHRRPSVVCLVCHGHVVASASPLHSPDWKIPAKLSRYCE